MCAKYLPVFLTHGHPPYSWRSSASSWESETPRPLNTFIWDKNMGSSSKSPRSFQQLSQWAVDQRALWLVAYSELLQSADIPDTGIQHTEKNFYTTHTNMIVTQTCSYTLISIIKPFVGSEDRGPNSTHGPSTAAVAVTVVKSQKLCSLANLTQG